MRLGKRTEDSEIFGFNSIALIKIEEVEISRYRITFKTIRSDILCECTPPTVYNSETENANEIYANETFKN